MQPFFKELKVVELANVLAGPAVGMFFAELGADVTKIENKLTNGDVTRSWKLSTENINARSSAYYASVNWHKKSLFLDLNLESDKQKIIDLLKNADVVISNYKPGNDKKLGMDYESIKKINPKIIYAHITAFGMGSKRTAYDLILQAETGFMSMNGTAESGPLKMPVALIDVLTAHQLKEAILIALIKKLKTGEGSHVTVSLYDAAISSLANQASNWLMVKNEPHLSGSLHPNIAPYGELFETKDFKNIVLAIGTDKQFIKLCSILNLENLPTDVRFNINTNRLKNRIELFDILKSAIKNLTSESLMKSFIENDVPAGLIRNMKDVLQNQIDPSFILSEINEVDGESKRVKTIAFQLN